jgi:high-affinity nickel permease
MRVLKHVGSLGRPAVCGRSSIEAKPPTITTLSVALAMILGTVLLLQMAARALGLSNGFWGPVQSLDLGHLGYGMVAVSIVIRPGAAIVWKKRIQPKERT